MMDIGDIVTVVTTSGEYVGKFVDKVDGYLTIGHPRMILTTGDGKMGFARGIAVTGVDGCDSVCFENVVFMTPTNSQVANAWMDATSTITMPPKPTLVK
jgi:hypothetical protein